MRSIGLSLAHEVPFHTGCASRHPRAPDRLRSSPDPGDPSAQPAANAAGSIAELEAKADEILNSRKAHALGHDPATIAQDAGHADMAVTFRISTHVMRLQEGEPERLKALVNGGFGTK